MNLCISLSFELREGKTDTRVLDNFGQDQETNELVQSATMVVPLRCLKVFEYLLQKLTPFFEETRKYLAKFICPMV